MGKICFIAFHDLYLMQFLYKYLEILDAHKIEYDVIYWERENGANNTRPFNGKKISFQYETSYYGSKVAKIKGYIKYISFVKKTLLKGSYDRAVLLTTQAALPMYLFSRQIRKKIRYIYDYRDLTYERNPLLKKIILNIIHNSQFTAISSLGFKEVLGDSGNFIISHNCSEMLKYIPVEKKDANKIRLVYWGMVRQVEFNKKVIDMFGRDDRFQLVYHGAGYVEELKEYSQSKGYRNVTFTGRYITDQILDFVAQTDILMNMYENDAQQKLATTVKLYDGMRYGLPMVITKGSHMERLMSAQDYVLSIDIDAKNADAVYDWYMNLEKHQNAYAKEIAKVRADDDAFEKRLLEFVRM